MQSLRLSMALSWVLGALALVPLELVALGSTRLSLLWTTTALSTGLGLVAGLLITLAESARRALGARGPMAALVRALPALPAFIWIGAHLFDGGMASTLPGAAWAPLWVPLFGFSATAATLWLAERMSSRPALRVVLAGALLAATAVSEYGNRTFLIREYPDVHAFMVLFSVVCAGALVHLMLHANILPLRWWSLSAQRDHRGGHPRAHATGRHVARVLVLVLLVLDLGLVVAYGLRTRADRKVVAHRGMHTRQIARVMRQLLDRDHDGYASVLGGGDCDDSDPRISPDADDIPGDGVDQDCDGDDTAPEPVPEPRAQERAQAESRALERWLDGPEVRDLIEQTRGYHVVFIVVDALRADALAVNQDNLTEYPNLQALARESRHFTRAFAPAAGTDVSLATLFTGRIDPFVRIETTLLEALSSAGLRTHAVLPREVLRWAGEPLLLRGLASHDVVITDKVKRDVGSHSTGVETTDLGLAFLDHSGVARATGADAGTDAGTGADAALNGKPVFLWLHYFDVHEHHQIESSDSRLREILGDDRSPGRRRKYRATTQLVDREIGRLRTELEARGMWQRTIVMFMSDHGEGLGEDERLPDSHGRFLYNPLVHVPLLIRIPGVTPARVDRPVSLVDIAPTLLALLGRGVFEGADGDSLLPWLIDSAPASARARISPIPLHESEQYGVIVWPHKLLVRPADNLIELYDLADDFAELNDISEQRPDLVKRLRAVYRGFPRVVIDRSLTARKRRDKLAQPAGIP